MRSLATLVLLQTGDLSWETGVSGTWIRKLVDRGVITPVAHTPRGERLFSVEAVATLKDWLADSQTRRGRPPRKPGAKRRG